jgi:hypothetical protein
MKAFEHGKFSASSKNAKVHPKITRSNSIGPKRPALRNLKDATSSEDEDGISKPQQALTDLFWEAKVNVCDYWMVKKNKATTLYRSWCRPSAGITRYRPWERSTTPGSRSWSVQAGLSAGSVSGMHSPGSKWSRCRMHKTGAITSRRLARYRLTALTITEETLLPLRWAAW